MSDTLSLSDSSAVFWSRTGRELTENWPRTGWELAENWPCFGRELAENWPKTVWELAENWPRTGRELFENWPRTGLRACISLLTNLLWSEIMTCSRKVKRVRGGSRWESNSGLEQRKRVWWHNLVACVFQKLLLQSYKDLVPGRVSWLEQCSLT